MPSTLITPPASEPLTLYEIKAHLRLDSGDEDSLLTRLISSARQYVENATRRALVTQAWRAFLDRWPTRRRVLLPVAPVQAVTEIRVFDNTGAASIVASSNYKLDASRTPAALIVQPAMLAPTARANGIEIDMNCGYGAPSDVPLPLREAILRLAAFWYEYRLDMQNGLGAAASVTDALIAPYRVIWP